MSPRSNTPSDKSQPTSYRQTVQLNKRTSIVVAAIDTFLRDGFENAGMTGIAKAAQVSTATLYKHFPSKEALFVAITDQLVSEVNPQIPDASLMDMKLEEGLIYVGNLFANTLNDPRLVPMYRLVIAEAFSFPTLRDRIHKAGLDPYTDTLVTFIEAKAKSGEVALGTARASFPVQQYIGMLSYLLLYSRVLDSEREISLEQARAVVSECAKTISSRFNAKTA